MRGFQKGITLDGWSSGKLFLRIGLSGVGIGLSGGPLDFSVKLSPLDFA